MTFILNNRRSGFSLAEAVIGIGLATVLILSIIALTTAALSGDQKAEMRQIALSTADSELNRFAKVVAVAGSGPRESFWTSGDGPYTGPGTRSEVKTNKTDFTLSYNVTTVSRADGSGDIGVDEDADTDTPDRNRLRKLDLTVTWWNGEEDKPGYGQLSVTSTRLLRESELRERS